LLIKNVSASIAIKSETAKILQVYRGNSKISWKKIDVLVENKGKDGNKFNDGKRRIIILIEFAYIIKYI